MKHSIPSALFLLLSSSLLPAAGAQRAESEGLQKIRRTFVEADRNADGLLDPAEAKRATIPSADFVSQDHDGDRKLSEDEFLLYYRQLLVGAEQKIDADIDREAARIANVRAKQAAEAARREAEAARRAAAEKQAAGGGERLVLSKNVAEKLKRAESALDAMVARGTLSREEADAKRAVLRRRAEAVSGRSRVPAEGANSGAKGADGELDVDVEKRFRRAEDALRQASGEGELSREEARAKQAKLAERARNAQRDAQGNERDKLNAELAKLDVEVAAGRLSKQDYETQRAALLDRAKRADKVGEDKPVSADATDDKAKARGEAARQQHRTEREKAEREQQQRERGEAARRQHQEAEKQRAERERLQREKAEAEKQRAERERLQREKAEAEKQRVERERLQRERAEAEKQRKDAERRQRAREEAERKAKEDGARKQP